MGIENRDYYRETNDYSGQWGSWGGTSSWPTVVKYLIIANVIVYLANIFLTRPATIDDVPLLMSEDEFVESYLAAERPNPTMPQAQQSKDERKA